MQEHKEVRIKGNPIISYECTKKIIKQMENNICKISFDEKQGTGFFCKIPFPDLNNMLPVFITNNHIIGRDLLYKGNESIEINIEEEENIKYINLKNRMRYTDKEDDITIIEIKEKDNIKNYLELDDKIINDILNDNNKTKIILMK